MACVPAPACIAALDQATGIWPARNRASDGICGDPAHQARVSDHNAGEAWDLTHDPAHGVDCNQLAETVKDDPRVKYVIWNRRIWNPAISRTWRPYTGSNPHTHHMHVSILRSARNNTAAWFAAGQEDEMTDADWKKLGEWLHDQDDRIVARVKKELLGTSADPEGLLSAVQKNRRIVRAGFLKLKADVSKVD